MLGYYLFSIASPVYSSYIPWETTRINAATVMEGFRYFNRLTIFPKMLTFPTQRFSSPSIFITWKDIINFTLPSCFCSSEVAGSTVLSRPFVIFQTCILDRNGSSCRPSMAMPAISLHQLSEPASDKSSWQPGKLTVTAYVNVSTNSKGKISGSSQDSLNYPWAE